MYQGVSIFIKKLSYVTFVQIFSMLVSAILTVFVPKLLRITDYGFWQLFMFYQGYIGVFHLGWNDGIYLQIGGKKYEELNRKELFSQLILLSGLQIIFAYFIILGSYLFEYDYNRKYIFCCLAISLVISNIRLFFQYILQATSRIKEFSVSIFADRITYLFFALYGLFVLGNSYKILLIGDIIGKTISLLVLIFFCRDIAFRRISDFDFDIKAVFNNIHIGIKLLFSNMATMLITGIIRWGIEYNWSIAVFGEISLSLTLAQIMITFINMIGIIIYPMLRNTNEKDLGVLYSNVRLILQIFIFTILIFYFPFSKLLISWIPAYKKSIEYMALLCPILFYESEMALLNNTYMKALRMERIMMNINIKVTIISAVLTFIFCFWLKNLLPTILSVLFLLLYRCYLCKKEIEKKLNLYDTFCLLEFLFPICFVLFHFYLGGILGWSMYIIYLIFFIIHKKKDIKYIYSSIVKLSNY